MIAVFESSSNDSNICVLGVGMCWLPFLIEVAISLVLCMMNNFGLYPQHSEYYYETVLPLIFLF